MCFSFGWCDGRNEYPPSSQSQQHDFERAFSRIRRFHIPNPPQYQNVTFKFIIMAPQNTADDSVSRSSSSAMDLSKVNASPGLPFTVIDGDYENATWTRYIPEAFGLRKAIRKSPYRWCTRERWREQHYERERASSSLVSLSHHHTHMFLVMSFYCPWFLAPCGALHLVVSWVCK